MANTLTKSSPLCCHRHFGPNRIPAIQGASSIYSVLDELAVSSAGDLMGFTKLEEVVFDGFFG
jgi:hypothetical protein